MADGDKRPTRRYERGSIGVHSNNLILLKSNFCGGIKFYVMRNLSRMELTKNI
jgi:hypothetical protein